MFWNGYPGSISIYQIICACVKMIIFARLYYLKLPTTSIIPVSFHINLEEADALICGNMLAARTS